MAYTIEGQILIDSETGWSDGEIIPHTDPDDFSFLNNSVTAENDSGYIVNAGDEDEGADNNNLDGSIITGNKVTWNGTPGAPITHGLFTGYNKNNVIKYNYLDKIPYAIVTKSGTDAGVNMANTSGAIAYNIFRNSAIGIRVKGINGTLIYNNTFYDNLDAGDYFISITSNDGVDSPQPSTGTKIKNNIFYSEVSMFNIYVETGSESGFECDYNLYYSGGEEIYFNYQGNSRTFAQWQALGYDTHSVVVDPNFVNTTALVPSVRLDYGTSLGATYLTGLSTTAVWTVDNTPATSDQNGSWQVGARVFGEEIVEEEISDTLVITISNQLPFSEGVFGTLQITLSNQIESIAVSTNAVTAITNTTATCGGNVTNAGGGTISARGVCWRMNAIPIVTDDFTTNGTGLGAFTSALTGLTPNRLYYVRAYATNESGTAYGAPVMFQTGDTIVPQPQNTGNLPTYRFYVYEAPTSVSYEVFPLNFLSTNISYEKDKTYTFYRKKFNGSLLFGSNSIVIDYDDGVTVHYRSEDWDLFWGIENMDPDAVLYLDIHKIVGGVTTTYWEGYFSTTDGKFDIDKCTFEVTPTVNDDYTGILEGADIQYNILSDLSYTIPKLTCHAFVDGTYDVYYDETRRFFDAAGDNTLEFLAQKLIPGVTVVSTFFSDALNPVDGETNKMRYLTISQKSDIIRPLSTNPASSAMISWNEMMDILWAMFQVTWTYDLVADTIYVEHISYFGHVAGLDLRTDLSTQATNKYSYIKEKMPKYEKFNFMEADNYNFVGWPIYYESSQVDQNPDTNVKELSVPVTTDLEHIINNPDAIADEGFVLLACDSSWNVLLDLGLFAAEVRLNMPLSWANLHDRFFRHNRILIEGYLNNQLITFITAQKTKRQACSTIVCSDFDPSDEITTELGESYFGGAKALVENASLHPSGELNLSLLYGPADNPAVFPAAQKWARLEQITCDHWHATFSETPTTAPTINMKYNIFESDHVSIHCFDAVGVDWDLSAVDNLTIAFCGGGIPVGGCVRFLNTIPVTTWAITFIYLNSCEC